MNDATNTTVTAWAKRRFPMPIDAELPMAGSRKWVLTIAYSIVPFGFFAVSAFLHVRGENPASAKAAFVFGCVMAVFFAGLAALLQSLQKRIVRRFDAEGVTTRAGRKHAWSALSHIDCRWLVHDRRKRLNRYELVFGADRAIVPLLLKLGDGTDATTFVRSIPAQMRDDGVVRAGVDA